MTACPWCGLEYDLNQQSERLHLSVCYTFQSLPVAETRESDGKQFVALPGYPHILVEREPRI